MARINDSRTFASEAEAQRYADDFVATWGSPFNPYEGTARIAPPNADRPTWLVYTSRNASAD